MEREIPLNSHGKTYSIIVPVYNNAESIPLLISELERIAAVVEGEFKTDFEAVFVVDGSPDDSFTLLQEALPGARLSSQLILHSRNFGSFAAIRTGLHAATGNLFAIIAADLQEPPELLTSFLENLLNDSSDIVVGVREGRDDPQLSRMSANLFWRSYRYLVVREIPEGGVDVFACNLSVRNELLKLDERNSSLVGLLFWLGYRRREVRYRRRARAFGKSAWTLSKKMAYLSDSVFSFSDLPIRALTFLGVVGLAVATTLGTAVTLLKVLGVIRVPGYAATILGIAFFGALNTLGIGLIGSYVWRTYENTKGRPLAVVRTRESFNHGMVDASAVKSPHSDPVTP